VVRTLLGGNLQQTFNTLLPSFWSRNWLLCASFILPIRIFRKGVSSCKEVNEVGLGLCRKPMSSLPILTLNSLLFLALRREFSPLNFRTGLNAFLSMKISSSIWSWRSADLHFPVGRRVWRKMSFLRIPKRGWRCKWKIQVGDLLGVASLSLDDKSFDLRYMQRTEVPRSPLWKSNRVSRPWSSLGNPITNEMLENEFSERSLTSRIFFWPRFGRRKVLIYPVK